jgi:hypothetical protein
MALCYRGGPMRHGILLALVMVRAAEAACPTDKRISVTHGSVEVDGVLDDATWQRACFVEDLTQKQPIYGAAPSHPIKVAVAIDRDTLYFGARMWAANRGDIDDALTQRDDTGQAERFIVSLDPSHTRRRAYSFAVTAQGVRADWIHTDDNEATRDLSWNPVWTAHTTILNDGWVAEMAIPLSQLRLPREPASSWGINFNWYVPHRQEDVFWRPVPPDRQAWSSHFGELVELPPVTSSVALELLPYAATRLTFDETPADRGPLGHRWGGGFDVGLDLKLRPLPGLRVVASINPDFGQVEQDPAFVNLGAYEVTLPEKRLFFTENSLLYKNKLGAFFYSRRIGGLPRTLPDADYLDLPPQVRILGAVAAGGYVGANTQIASLAAVTDQTSADAIVDGEKRSLIVSPLTAWGAGRVEHQVGRSVLSASATLVRRALDGTGLSGLLAQTAFAAGVEASLRTKNLTYEFIPYAGITGVSGTAEAITAIQKSSTHYFQRPDDPTLHVDTEARHLLGWQAGLFSYKKAGMWQGEIVAGAKSPGLELNDLGTLKSGNHLYGWAEATRKVTIPSKHVHAWDVGVGTSVDWNFNGLRKPVLSYAYGGLTFANFSTLRAYGETYSPGTSDDLTRGGPAMRTDWASGLTLTASTPNGRKWIVSGNLQLKSSATSENGVTASAALTARVTPGLRLDVTPSVTVTETHRQYVTKLSNGGGAATYGTRYLFGHLQRKEAALQLRATWAMTPDLALSLYAQPFASVGRYDALGELAAAGSGDIRWYEATARAGDMRSISDGADNFTIDEPDYNVTSLRSTAVLRWEPAIGSAVFVVWQQQRGGSERAIAPALRSIFSDVFTQSALHTIAVKLAFWFG